MGTPVFQLNSSSNRRLPDNEWLDDCIQAALCRGSTPTAAQRKQARIRLLGIARYQSQLAPLDKKNSAAQDSSYRLMIAVGAVCRWTFGLLRSCFVNDAPYHRANGTSVRGRRRIFSELGYLEFAPMI